MSLEELGERELTHEVRFTLAMSMIDEGFSNTEILDVFRPYMDFNVDYADYVLGISCYDIDVRI